MKINLNDKTEFTKANIAKLIGSVVDDRHWQLRVTSEGYAYLSELVGNQDLENIAYRMETWCSGNGYVGFQAAHDEQWVDQVFQNLVNNWPLAHLGNSHQNLLE